MKPNAFQKILSLIYLVLITISCVFYVPFEQKYYQFTKIVYDTIWSDNSNINLTRLGIFLLVISFIYYILYQYLKRMNDLDLAVYKRKAKIELIAFMVFISGILLCLVFLISYNAISQLRRNHLTSEMVKTQSIINYKTEKLAQKKSTRRNFWDESKKTLDLSIYDNNIEKYWQALITAKKYDTWLNSFYSKIYNSSLQEFKIYNLEDFKNFIDQNTINGEDNQKQLEVKLLLDEYNQTSKRNSNLTFFHNNDIWRITFFFLAFLFCIIYIVRPLSLFVKDIFIELR